MEKGRGFNFRLLVPPRVNTGQVSAVRPQETADKSSDLVNPLQQANSKGLEKEQSMAPPSLFVPSKPPRPDFPNVKVVPPMEKGGNNCTHGQLYSKLFDEVEKINCWKVKVHADTVQKEKGLQDNKRTIETQRKAIQELQFGNESLSMKLEEQISENEDLRNKSNTTRNMFNILKDTFQHSTEKMHLFESEREETHNLFKENSESIQKLIAAFESLRVRAEADQQQLHKVKEDLLQSEDVKEKYHQEYNMKEKQVTELQTKMTEKESELQKVLFDLHETQTHRKQLQEATNDQYGLLKSSKTQQEYLVQKLHSAEQQNKDTEKKRDAVAAMLEQSKAEYGEIIQNKDLSLQELSRVNSQQAQKLEEMQTSRRELQNSLASEMQRTKELESKLVTNDQELERTNTLLAENLQQSAKKDKRMEMLEDELDNKSKSVESLKGKIEVTEVRMEELTAELSRKSEEAQIFKNEAEAEKAENLLLKKACVAAENTLEDLKEKFTLTEIRVQELEGQLFTQIQKNKEQTFQMEQLREDSTQHQEKYNALLSNFNELQSEKTSIQQQLESGSSDVKALEANMKVSEEKAVKLTNEIHRLQKENQSLREEVNSVQTKSQHQETETVQKEMEETRVLLQEELTDKENQIKAMEKKNKMLKKQVAKENAKSSQLEILINGLQEETQNLKRLNEEDHQKLLKDLESKSTFAAELEKEVEKLRVSAAEAVKNKEDIEVKCQHKIADMVALMEKHKSQYDRMVEEKDAELDENKKKEAAAVTHRKSLELDLTKHKSENDQLKLQIEAEIREKENMQKELTDLKKEMSSVKTAPLSEARNYQFQSPAPDSKQGRCSETPKDGSLRRHVFDFSRCRTIPSHSRKTQSGAESIRTPRGTPTTQTIHNEGQKTPRSMTSRVGGTSKIKSYRIRTPPSAEKAAGWRKSIQFEPKSDSSDQSDLLTFTTAPRPVSSAPRGKMDFSKQSPAPKLPGNSLKVAAMKRMRDAGWTAVTGSDKKKKTTIEKIFA